ncbi:AAEL013291-PA [Aedes aegypti]|uniref:AAEL013291-PA n=1 Tax=Aedes aegypti TaxID=7159 RepID=Q16JL9_AEDAE|nr:AAEL013291-PA [Aedes aegypti]
MIGTAAAALHVAPERTNNTSGETRTNTAPTATMSVDENDSASGNFAASSTAGIDDGLAAMSPGSGRGGGRRTTITEQGSDGSDKNNSKRKTRRGKTKRGKRSSSARPYSKSQWKYHVPMLRSTAANKRRVKVSLGGLTTRSAGIITTKDPFILSDQPPLVPYNTNRFLMEDHMPHVLTPSEDEEEFLTKEFSSVYEDARSERLEGLSKSQLIQEYLQLEANYEQVMRRYNAVKSLSIREENESAVNNATMTTKDAIEGGVALAAAAAAPVAAATDRRRLEDRIRELTAENLELRRQLEHASRLGMVLSAKSSPRSYGGASGPQMVERMDSSSCHGTSSEDSESDSSSSTSSSSSDNDDDDGSSSSMSDDDNDDRDREPLVVAMEGSDEAVVPMESNGCHQNGDLLADDEEELSDEDHNGPLSPLSGQSINSPPPPPLVMN